LLRVYRFGCLVSLEKRRDASEGKSDGDGNLGAEFMRLVKSFESAFLFFLSFPFWFGCHLRFSVAFGGVTHVISYLSYYLDE
jgi:hypothetical protein